MRYGCVGSVLSWNLRGALGTPNSPFWDFPADLAAALLQDNTECLQHASSIEPRHDYRGFLHPLGSFVHFPYVQSRNVQD